MASFVRRATRHVLISLNIFIAVLFLLPLLIPYVNAAQWWVLGVLAILIPVDLILLSCFIVLWLFTKPKRIFISVVSFIIGWKLISHSLEFHPLADPKHKDSASFKMITWNGELFGFFDEGRDSSTVDKMIAMLRKQDADIICLQEFVYRPIKNSKYSIYYFAKNLGMPYYAVASDSAYGVHNEAGPKGYHHFSIIIFSKFPVLNWKKVQPHERDYNQTFLYADLKLPHDTFRVFNIHLQSIHFGERDFEFMQRPEDDVAGFKERSRSILGKLKRGFLKRAEQAEAVRKEIDKSPYPAIVCGDFNDVPNSYTYQTIKGQLSDAFRQRGNGFGRTFTRISPTLRIDYILPDKNLKTLYYRALPAMSSDHFPVMAILAERIPGTEH